MYELLLRGYRQDAAKRQTDGIKFTHRQKLGATRCTDASQTWQGQRARGSAWLCKISPQSAQWVGMRPQRYEKFPLFGKELPRRGEPFDRFLKFYGYLYAQLSCFRILHL